MPVYVYEVVRRDAKAGRRFEVFQNMTDKPLTRDPESGEPIRRVFFPPNLPKNRYEKTVKKIQKEDRTESLKTARKRG